VEIVAGSQRIRCLGPVKTNVIGCTSYGRMTERLGLFRSPERREYSISSAKLDVVAVLPGDPIIR
jgi:hypothetical protein